MFRSSRKRRLARGPRLPLHRLCPNLRTARLEILEPREMLVSTLFPPTLTGIASLNGSAGSSNSPYIDVTLAPSATGGVPPISSIVLSGYNFASPAFGFSGLAQVSVNQVDWTTDAVPNQSTIDAHPPNSDNSPLVWGTNTIQVFNPSSTPGSLSIPSDPVLVFLSSAAVTNVQLTPISPAPMTNASFTISLTGTNFSTTDDFSLSTYLPLLTFAGPLPVETIPLTPSNLTSTSVTIPVPALPLGGNFNLSISSANGTVTLPIVVTDPAPAITGVTSSSESGDSVLTYQVAGSGFVPGAAVTINGASRTTFYVSSTELKVNLLPTDVDGSQGVLNVVVTDPAPTAGPSNVYPITFQNPTPVLSGLSQSSAPSGSGPISLQLFGSGFTAASLVDWNSTALTPTAMTGSGPAETLQVTVPASLLAVAGTAQVSVNNPGASGGTNSAALPFTVGSNGLGVIGSAPVGSPDTQIAVYGSGFLFPGQGGSVTGSVVVFNGTSLSTVYYQAEGYLLATIPAALLTTAGAYEVTVTGGGTAGPGTFLVLNPTPTISSTYTPPAATIGQDYTLTVMGSDFVDGASIEYLGTYYPTTFDSSTELTAIIPGSMIQVQLGGPSPSLTAAYTVVNPGPPSLAQASGTFPLAFPTPSITSTSDDEATYGDGDTTFLIEGSGFEDEGVYGGTTAYLSGASGSGVFALLATTFISAGDVAVTIPAEDLSITATVCSLWVTNGVTSTGTNLGETTSNSVTFTINNPVPVVESTSSTFTGVQQTVNLTLTGAGFVPGAEVQWSSTETGGFNGMLPALVSGNELIVSLGEQQVAIADAPTLTVVNPGPGGGSSDPFSFVVVAPVSNPPSSSVAALPPRTSLTSIPVSWSGTAGSGGPITTYDISVSIDGGAFTPWLTGTTLTSSTYTATLGHTYSFISQATDATGNVEPAHTTADATITTTSAPWQNPGNPLDVAGNGGQITPADALDVINYLNLNPAGTVLPTTFPAGSEYLDIRGTGIVIPADALKIINFLNTVPLTATMTTLTSSSTTSTSGESVTFTATVTAQAPSTAIPTGTVTFYDGTTVLGTGTLNSSGVATFTTSALTAGTHSIQADYDSGASATANFAGSNSSLLTQTVNAAAPAVQPLAASASQSANNRSPAGAVDDLLADPLLHWLDE
jgi:hypothetical protein